jgi:hypothetical protein
MLNDIILSVVMLNVIMVSVVVPIKANCQNLFSKTKIKYPSQWRHDTQHNDIQHNDAHRKGLICDIQYNRTLFFCGMSIYLVSRFVIVMPNVIALSVAFFIAISNVSILSVIMLNVVAPS